MSETSTPLSSVVTASNLKLINISRFLGVVRPVLFHAVQKILVAGPYKTDQAHYLEALLSIAYSIYAHETECTHLL